MWPFGNKTTRKARSFARVIRAKFDAAVTNADNVGHWANADSLSADAAASPDVRQTLRNRSRYEVANNSYARGIVLTLANDCVGTGPRLQLLSDDTEANDLIETAFADWASEIRLAAKLRLMRMAKAVDGEVFGMLTANPVLRSPIKLDLQLIEADRVANSDARILIDDAVDGIQFDRFGNPIRYLVLRRHPGRTGFAPALDGYDRVPAEAMVHWFRSDRPGQHRGIPEITPALPLFAQLRRYTLAVLGAAETAADFAAVLFTDAPANGEAASVEPMDIVELEKRMATVLPDGWKLGQIKAEQPGTTYGELKRELLNEIARCLNMPFNVAAGKLVAEGLISRDTSWARDVAKSGVNGFPWQASIGAAVVEAEFIGVQKKLGKDLDTEVAALCGLMDQIAAYLRRRALPGVPGAAWVRTQNEPVYAPEHLAEQRVFTSVLTVTYRAIG